jgi:PAS domain S-box-containing protein
MAHTAGLVVNNEGKVEATFRNLLEAAPDEMIAVSGEGNMIFVNARTEILFGYDRHEILGQKIEMLVPERFRNSHILRASDKAVTLPAHNRRNLQWSATPPFQSLR